MPTTIPSLTDGILVEISELEIEVDTAITTPTSADLILTIKYEGADPFS